MNASKKNREKYFNKFKKPLVKLPNLIESQLISYRNFVDEGIAGILKEFTPIEDYSGKKFKIEFLDFKFEEPDHDEFYAKENKQSYQAVIKVNVKLTNKILKIEKEQEIFLTDFPMMTEHGTFVINGVERVIVPQLSRSFGMFFTVQELRGGRYFGAKIIPYRGAWVEIESEADGLIYVKIDRKRKFLASSLLRALAPEGADITSFFKDKEAKEIIQKSIENDPAKNAGESFIEIHRRLRDGELTTASHAKVFVDNVFSEERYDLHKVGRFYFNKRFGKSMDKKELNRKIISVDDIATTIEHIVKLNRTPNAREDDIDHLGSRRLRYFGEMVQQKFRVGMFQIKRNIQDRMSIIGIDATLPAQLVNPRPLQARVKEFFATNQLSQFMLQDNVLAELEHLRTVSALGPGGLARERASIEVRDVHPTHYGRICPIQTPEGQNIGLILHLANYAKVNDFGMIETPYAKVENGKISSEITYLNAADEETHNIADATIDYDQNGKITARTVEVRTGGKLEMVDKQKVDYIDISTAQAFSIATSMIPFLNHDDANRALMGSNMQKQSVPCVVPEAPLVATGVEEKAARDSGRLIIAKEDGTISYVDSRMIKVKSKNSKDTEYKLLNFIRTNNFSALCHRPIVDLNQKVKKGDILADASSTDQGQIALGQNILVAFMPWYGANYEDAIIISDRLVTEDKFTSIYVEEFVEDVRDTKLGEEITTHDIPNVGEAKLKNLDEEGIVRIGAEVRQGDILVGKITPKGETQLTPEERLLKSIFGEKAQDVKDTSLRVKGGKRGFVKSIKIFSRDKGEINEPGVIKRIYVEVAHLRNVSVGDKLAGRHGNKGVISKILPQEDMPFMKDGTPIDIILTPLGVPSRMNLGQILELHLGMAARSLGYQAIVPPFAGATEEEIKDELEKAGLSRDGTMTLYDGLTGESFDQNVAVGYMYMLKLHHMIEDKLHMRSIGPYSLINQQPLGGKAQKGGQRFGEMEVWALLGHGTAHILREVLTIKSDDILGRSAAFDAIVKGKKIPEPNIPASFNVLLNNLRGLVLDIDLKK